MRKAFSVHADYYEELRNLDPERRGALILALIDWAEDAAPPALDPECAILFRLMTAQMEREEKRVIARDTQEYRNWHASVLARDKYTCQICGKRGGKIHAHHIKRYKSFSALRTEISNGITLCEQCHRDLHAREGY